MPRPSRRARRRGRDRCSSGSWRSPTRRASWCTGARRCSTLLNAYPYTNGHVLVMPDRACAELDELDDETYDELWREVRSAVVAHPRRLRLRRGQRRAEPRPGRRRRGARAPARPRPAPMVGRHQLHDRGGRDEGDARDPRVELGQAPRRLACLSSRPSETGHLCVALSRVFTPGFGGARPRGYRRSPHGRRRPAATRAFARTGRGSGDAPAVRGRRPRRTARGPRRVGLRRSLHVPQQQPAPGSRCHLPGAGGGVPGAVADASLRTADPRSTTGSWLPPSAWGSSVPTRSSPDGT